jgi:3',5'-cyclic AMP phosphodiesterase CpdA
VADRFRAMTPSASSSRRRFLQQSFFYSAAFTLGSRARLRGADTERGPADFAPDDHHYLMIGDWGYDNTRVNQVAVAQAMRGYVAAKKLTPDGLFLLGDNFYGPFKGGTNCPRWKNDFEDIYPASSFPGPCWAILGNHDYDDEPVDKLQAELAYAKANPGTRWTMPAKWYRLELPEKNPVATILMLDSDYHNSAVSLTAEEKAAQMKWLVAELEKPRTTPYLIVMGHHPLYSNGHHGDDPALITDWEPLFKKYSVQFYFFGHDHDLQHLEFAHHPTSFVGSGAGGANLYEIMTPERGPYSGEVFGFTHLQMNAERIVVRHFDSEQKQVHAFSKVPAGKISILA